MHWYSGIVYPFPCTKYITLKPIRIWAKPFCVDIVEIVTDRCSTSNITFTGFIVAIF